MMANFAFWVVFYALLRVVNVQGTSSTTDSTSTSDSTTATTSTESTSTGPTSTGSTSTGPTSTGSTATGSTSTGSAATGSTSTGSAATGSTSTGTATSPSTTSAASTRKPWPKPNCGDSDLTNNLRSVFLDLHNALRGSLARGQTQISAGWGIAPPAALMYRMKYSCDAESYAIQYVRACRTGGLPEYTHPGYKVNRHTFANTGASRTNVVRNAVMHWWAPLSWYGMRSNMMFYASEYARGFRNVLTWSKMAWWNNNLIGCAIQHCGHVYYTACMYRPGGNNIGQYVYKVGAVCSDCPAGQCDGQALCRW